MKTMKRLFLLLTIVFWGTYPVLSAESSVVPEPGEGMQLWLQASDYADARWKDRSGKRHDAVQSATSKQPTRIERVINGFPVVRFQPEHWLECGDFMAGSSAITIFAVVSKTAKHSTAFVLAAKHGPFATVDGEWVYRLGQPDSSINSQEFCANQAEAKYLFSGAVVSTGVSNFMVCSLQWRQDAQPAFANNGSALDAVPSKWNTIKAMPKTRYPIQIGTVEGLNAGSGGDLAELIIYNTALSAVEVAQVTRYLKRKYFTQQIIFDGNSLTIGVSTTMPYPTQVMPRLAGEWASYNLGVNRQTTLQMSADAVAQVDALFEPDFKKNILVAWEITNEMAFGSKSAKTCYDDFVSYCAARKAAGFKVIALTVLPRSDSPREDFESNRLQVNEWIKKNYATFADAVADVAADRRIGQTGAALDSTYFTQDKVHLNDVGAGVVAAIVVDKINSK